MHCFSESPMFREQALSDCLSRVHEEALVDMVRHFQGLEQEWGADRFVWEASHVHVDADGHPWALVSLSLLPAEVPAALREQVEMRAVRTQIALRHDNELAPSDL